MPFPQGIGIQFSLTIGYLRGRYRRTGCLYPQTSFGPTFLKHPQTFPDQVADGKLKEKKLLCFLPDCSFIEESGVYRIISKIKA